MTFNASIKVGLLVASLSRNAGGIYDATRFLARALNDRSDSKVAAFGVVDDHLTEDAIGWGDVCTYAAPVVGFRQFGYAPKLLNTLTDWAPDILHVHGLWMYPSIASCGWNRKSHKPYIISPHGMLDYWAVRNSRWKKWLAAMLFEDSHLRKAACIHVLSESEMKAVRAYGLTNPICVIPNGIDLPTNQSPELPDWAKKISDEAKVLLYLGRIHPKKGLCELIVGWQLVTKQIAGDEWHLILAGWNQVEHEAELREMIDNLGLSDFVHLVGPQFNKDKIKTYQRADAFVLPSLSEGLPMVVLEAWSYELPVLMTRECNLPEGFDSGAAIEVRPDSNSVAEGLRVLFNMTDAERAEMGLKGKDLVVRKFQWSKIGEQMSNVYRWILGQSPPPPCVNFYESPHVD